MALAETARLVAQLTLDDKMSAGLNKASGNLNKFQGGLGRAGQGLGKISSGFARAGTLLAGATVAGFTGAAKAAIDWEDAFQGVVKTVDASDADLDALALNLRNLSTEMPTTAIDLASIAEAAGQMGVGVDKSGKTSTAAIAAFTKQVAILAETTDLSAEQAATSIGQMTAIIGLSADQFDNFAASLVALGNAGNSTESAILEVARRSGGAAKQIGIAKDETLGWAAAAANLGINQELAGTSLQSFYLKANRAVGTGGEKLKVLAETAGLTSKEFRSAFNKDATEALGTFIEGLAGLDKFKKQKVIESVFGTTSGLSRLLIGLSNNVDGIGGVNQSLDENRKSWKEAIAAQEEFEKRNATVKSAISRLRNGLIDAAVTVGEGFAPALGRAADKLNAFLKLPENRTALKTLGEDIGKSLDAVDWKAVLDGAKDFVGVLKIALDYAKRLFDVLASLPNEVKAAGLGFLALNKLSGGLIGAGVADVVGGLGSSIAKSIAASLPGVGRAFVQPVMVTNFPPGFGKTVPGTSGPRTGTGTGTPSRVGNVASKGLSALGKVLIIGEAIGLVLAVKGVADEISAGNTLAASNLQATLTRDISDKTPEQLRTALAGVQKGINDLQANPLNVLVQGSALDTLKGMESQLQEALNKNPEAKKGIAGIGQQLADGLKKAIPAFKIPELQKTLNANLTKLQGLQDKLHRAKESGDKQRVEALKGRMGEVKNRIDVSKSAIVQAQQATKAAATAAGVRAANATNSAATRIVAGFHQIAPPTVNVYVTASTVQKSVTYQNRSGPGNGSAGGGDGGKNNATKP